MPLKASVNVDTATDAVLLKLDRNVFHHGGLFVIRSLGRLGIRVHAMREDRFVPAGASRYARRMTSPMPVLADEFNRAGQAAGWYSLMTPPARRVRRIRKASRSVTFGGSGFSGAAPDRLMCGLWLLWWDS